MKLVDCQTCPVREVHCPDCMVTALTRIPVGALPQHQTSTSEPVAADRLPLDPAERRAAAIFLAGGLISRETVDTLTATFQPVRSSRGRQVRVSASRRAAG